MEPSLRCPSCGNPLAIVDAPTVKCPFCKMTVPVPAMFRRPVQVVVPPQNPYAMDVRAPYVAPYPAPHLVRRGRSSGAPAAIVVVAAAMVIAGAAASLVLMRSAPRPPTSTAPTEATAVAAEQPKDENEPILSFGGKGTGAGRFEDGRALAIGPDGEVWVAEYEDGRVQQFDAKGKFARVIQVPPESPNGNIYVSSMAADRAGHLFVARNGEILRFAVATGALEATFKGVDAWSIAVDPANTIWAVDLHDTLVHLDGQGKTLHKWTGVIEAANKKDPAMSPEIAVDGAGHVYLSSVMSGYVYVFDSEGHFQNRFGVKGDDGNVMAGGLTGIAVDPRGHVWVGHLWMISEYDADGAEVRDLSHLNEGIRSFAFDDQGHLFVMTTTQQKVVELDVSKGGGD